MDKTVVKHRTKVTSEQLAILKALNKFRYGSKAVVAEYLDKEDETSVFRRLEILVELGLVAKRYKDSYRLQGKPAAYYLTPTGAKALDDWLGDDSTVNMKLLYKNKMTSEGFVAHCLNIFHVRNQLKAKYGDEVSFFTKPDMAGFDHFPQPLPDAFVTVKKNDRLFFVEVMDENTQLFVVKKRIKQYITYEDGGGWEGTDADFPIVIFICPSNEICQKVTKYIEKLGSELVFRAQKESDAAL